MAKTGSLWYALHAPRKAMITESNSTERGSENRTPSAHMQAEPLAGPAAFSAVCVCLARGEEVCPAPWGFCCCLVGWLVLFCFYTLGCKTCAEPPECVLSKRAPPLHDLCIRESTRVRVRAGVRAGVRMCTEPTRGLPAAGTGCAGCFPGHTHPPWQAVHWVQGRACFFTHPIHVKGPYRDPLACVCSVDLAALDGDLWDNWNFYQIFKAGESC